MRVVITGKAPDGRTWVADAATHEEAAKAEQRAAIAKAVGDGLDFATDRLSTQVRTIAIGCIAIVWSLMTGDVKKAPPVDSQATSVVALLALLALVFDACQYLAAYRVGTRAQDEIKAGNVDAPYDDDWMSWKIRMVFFWFKIVCAGVAALLLVIAIVAALPNTKG